MSAIILSATYLTNPLGTDSHYHDCHQILYITKGQACVTIGEKTYLAGPGSVVIISRFEEHAVCVKEVQYHRFALRIAPLSDGALPFFSVLVNRSKNFSHVVAVQRYRKEIESLFHTICNEITEPLSDEKIMLRLLLQQLLIYLVREEPNLLSVSGGEESRIVDAVKQTLETQYPQTHSLASLAAEQHISASYLSHAFKSVTGISVMGYLLSCRIAAAKDLLTKTDLPIGEIVELCGFSDDSNFARTFKHATGTTPRAFRARYGK